MSDYGDDYDEQEFDLLSVESEDLEEDEDEDEDDEDKEEDEKEEDEEEDAPEIVFDPTETTTTDDNWYIQEVSDEDNKTSNCLTKAEYTRILGQFAQLIAQGYDIPQSLYNKKDEIEQAQALIRERQCPIKVRRPLHTDDKKKIQYVKTIDPNIAAHPIMDLY